VYYNILYIKPLIIIKIGCDSDLDELYDINLFSEKFIINDIKCKLILQLLIQIDAQNYVRIYLLQSALDISELFLIAIDYHNKKIVPIQVDILNIIIRAIKHINFTNEMCDLINNLVEREREAISDTKFVRISNNVTALLNSKSDTARNINIEVELFSDSRLIPNSFVFAAFDGINTSIYFV